MKVKELFASQLEQQLTQEFEHLIIEADMIDDLVNKGVDITKLADGGALEDRFSNGDEDPWKEINHESKSEKKLYRFNKG
jgi:hypothetical protein